jgi:hypothetical protein
LGGGQHAPGEEDLPRQTIAQYPEHFVTDIRLEAIQRQDNAPTGFGNVLKPGRIREGQAHQFVVPLQQIGNGAGGNNDPAVSQVLVNFGDAAVLRIAQRPDPGEDIKSKFVFGEGEPPLCFWPIRVVPVRTDGIAAPPNLEREVQHRV